MVVSEEQKAIIELLQSMKGSLDANTEELKSQRVELDKMKKDIPEFLSQVSRGGRGSPKTQEDILSLVDEMLVLGKDDRPEYLSERSIRQRVREEGIDKVGDVAAQLLHRAHMHDIPLRYPIQWVQDEADDKW